MADRWQQWNLPDSRYVWLPLEFDGEGRPVLSWRDHWSLSAVAAAGAAATPGLSRQQ